MEKKILSFEEFSKQYTEGTLGQDNTEMDMDTADTADQEETETDGGADSIPADDEMEDENEETDGVDSSFDMEDDESSEDDMTDFLDGSINFSHILKMI